MKSMSYFFILAIVVLFQNVCGQEIKTTEIRQQKIDSLLKAVGGKTIWASAKGFRMVEIANYSKLNHPLVREFWVDFETPRIKVHTKSIERRQITALNDESGWTLDSNSEIAVWDSNKVKGWRSFWPGIPTRIFAMLARDDDSITYKVYEDRIDFYINEIFAVWIATTVNGTPVAYGREKEHTETHFLGEVLPYGPVKLWKDAYEPGGLWRFTMVDYEILDNLTKVSFERPN